MQLRNFSIVLFTLITKTCVSRKILEIPKSDDSSNLVEATVKVLTSCYGNQTNVFGLARQPFGAHLRKLWHQKSHSVVLIDNTTRAAINGEVRRELPYKLQLFVVAAASSTELLQILRHIKETRWWNHMASFLIIDLSSALKNGCSNAFKFLWTAWKMNLLNAKFMCIHPTNGRWIHGYNPYTKTAPEPWQLINTFASNDDHPWSLFKRKYQEYGMCHGLDFDKTADLGGYEIRATVKSIYTWHIDFNKTGVDSFGGIGGITTQTIFHALHANAKLHIFKDTEGPGLLDRNGSHVMMEVVNGNSDIALNAQFQRNIQNATLTTAFMQMGLTIMTQSNSEMSQLSKLLSVIDVTSRYGVLLVLIVTFIFFKYFRCQDTITAILNLLRIICNSPLTRVPTNVPARIYLSSLFIFAITILALYQGQLSSLLTNSASLPNVETLQDLADRGYTIYGHKSLAYLFSDPSYKGRFIGTEEYNCTNYVLRDSSTACLAVMALLINDANEFKLHLSRDTFQPMPVVYVIREDWPLEQRFNIIIATLIEADIIQRMQTEKIRKHSAILKFYDKLKEKQHFEVITLMELGFAFVILAIGLTLAAVCFIVEVAIR